MARVAVVGDGIGGLCSALLLGREGHQVVVCERDPARGRVQAGTEGVEQLAASGHSAGSARPLVPGRVPAALRERLPDVLDALLAAGATEHDNAASMPGEEHAPRTPSCAS